MPDESVKHLMEVLKLSKTIKQFLKAFIFYINNKVLLRKTKLFFQIRLIIPKHLHRPTWLPTR